MFKAEESAALRDVLVYQDHLDQRLQIIKSGKFKGAGSAMLLAHVLNGCLSKAHAIGR